MAAGFRVPLSPKGLPQFSPTSGKPSVGKLLIEVRWGDKNILILIVCKVVNVFSSR